MRTVLIASHEFTLFDTADEFHAYLEKLGIEWEPMETPEPFPCLVEFQIDTEERCYPVIYTAKDVKAMAKALRGAAVAA